MECLFWFLLILQFLISIGQNLDYRQCGKVYLTVSSLQENFLEMNWVQNCPNSEDILPDFITIYDYDVTKEGYDKAKLRIKANDFPGYYKTDIKFGPLELPNMYKYSENKNTLPKGKYCYRFWITSWSKGKVLDSDCFSLNPSWMSDISDAIKDKRIGNLMIPGTHNSGTYLSKGKLFQTYVMNQEVDIWQQLVYGIRYLDFRVGYYGMEKFTINHDILTLGNLQPLLVQLKTFLKLSPKEVVVLDFHRFPVPPVINNEAHKKLVKLIYSELGEFVVWPDKKYNRKGPTIQEILETGRNLIIAYGEQVIVKEYPWLWSPLKQYWGDKRNPNDLHAYLSTIIEKHATGGLNPMWAVMAELTPRAVDVIFHKCTLRKLSDQVNRHVTVWFRNKWSKSANIVATDYFFGNDIINIAIEANKAN